MNPMGLGRMARVKRTSWALGTQVTLSVFHPEARTAEAAITRAFKELDRVEDILSLYRSNSQVSRLNRTGHLDDAHPYLLEVLKTAADMSRLSNGAFDVTVQPLYLLHAENAKLGRRPSAAAMKETLAKVGWEQIEVKGSSVHLHGKGVEITLNGIAQGFAADVVNRVLREEGIEHALIDTGEIGAVGHHVEKESWTIGIKHPRESGDFLAMADLKDRSLATSGDYETRFGDGYEHHHLLNPGTGQSPLELSSVTVAAPNALLADALSTTLFLTGSDAGMRLIRSFPQTDVLFVTKTGKIIHSDGFPIRN
jgi:FAD:protein FMN transferase